MFDPDAADVYPLLFLLNDVNTWVITLQVEHKGCIQRSRAKHHASVKVIHVYVYSYAYCYEAVIIIYAQVLRPDVNVSGAGTAKDVARCPRGHQHCQVLVVDILHLHLSCSCVCAAQLQPSAPLLLSSHRYEPPSSCQPWPLSSHQLGSHHDPSLWTSPSLVWRNCWVIWERSSRAEPIQGLAALSLTVSCLTLVSREMTLALSCGLASFITDLTSSVTVTWPVFYFSELDVHVFRDQSLFIS